VRALIEGKGWEFLRLQMVASYGLEYDVLPLHHMYTLIAAWYFKTYETCFKYHSVIFTKY